MPKTIDTWSFSRLLVYEKCPHEAELRYIEKIPEPPREAGNAADRGIIVHKEAENFVLGSGPLTPGMKRFEAQFNALRAAFIEGNVTVEEEWGIDQNWQPCGYWEKNVVWGRIKLDAMHTLTPDHARVIDYKTGKSFNNEVKHIQQGFFYAIIAFLRNPELQIITFEFWYLDENHTLRRTITREQAMNRLPKWDTRAKTMTQATRFPTHANKHNCRFCPYRPGNLGTCPDGIPPD